MIVRSLSYHHALLLLLMLAYVVSEELSSEHHSHPHKALFPLDASDYIGTLLIALGLLVAASGGIGGGGILVPLYIMVYGFKPKYAIALSNFTILGASIMNMILNCPKRHPDPLKDRPLVDWDLVTIMQPLTMAGTIAGTFIGSLLPDYIVIVLLIVLLSFTTHSTLLKGISQYQGETAAAQGKSSADVMRESVAAVKVSEESGEKAWLLEGAMNNTENTGFPKPIENAELAEIIENEKSSPMVKVAILTTMFVGIILLNVLKGGKGESPIGIECGSSSYWILTILIFVWVGGIFMYLRHMLIEEWRVKKRLRYRYDDGDIEWTPLNTLYYPAICTLAGLFAGMFGIGGGIVMGPLMLEMGVPPQVTSATSAAMTFYTAFTGTSAFIAFGLITWDYAWFLFVIGLMATAIGQFGVSYLVHKYKRTSYISLSIGAVVAISTVLLTLESLINSNESEIINLC
jgi:uncharacterized membrane protein YfcA